MNTSLKKTSKALAAILAPIVVMALAMLTFAAVRPNPAGNGYIYQDDSGLQTPFGCSSGMALSGGLNGIGPSCVSGGGGSGGGPLGNADGVDIVGPFDAGLVVVQISGDGGTNDNGQAGYLPILPTEVSAATGTDFPVFWTTAPVTFRDATTWQTVLTYTPTKSGESDDVYVLFEAHDWSGIAGGGVNTDAGGPGGGVAPTLNVVKFLAEVHLQVLNLLSDAGAGSQVYLCANGASPCNVPEGTPIAISPAGITDQHGCATTYSTAGCVSDGTTTWAAQATVTAGVLTVQVQANGTTSWPWVGEGKTPTQRRSFP